MERAWFVQDRLEEEREGRVYYGEETCERRIPAARDYKRAVSELKNRGNQVTLVFPPVTDSGLAKTAGILKELEGEDDLECVVADYGLLKLASERMPRMSFIVGRLLSRVLARNIIDLEAYDPKEAELFRERLKRQRVRRFDFDLFNLELVKAGLDDLGFPASLITPFDIIAFTRRCVIAGCSTTDDDPFAACKQECREMTMDLSHSYLTGTHFVFENVVLKLAEAPKSVDKNVDRLVRWHPPQLRVSR